MCNEIEPGNLENSKYFQSSALSITPDRTYEPYSIIVVWTLTLTIYRWNWTWNHFVMLLMCCVCTYRVGISGLIFFLPNMIKKKSTQQRWIFHTLSRKIWTHDSLRFIILKSKCFSTELLGRHHNFTLNPNTLFCYMCGCVLCFVCAENLSIFCFFASEFKKIPLLF